MMDKQHIEALIKNRLDKAKETIGDAELLAKADRWMAFCEWKIRKKCKEGT